MKEFYLIKFQNPGSGNSPLLSSLLLCRRLCTRAECLCRSSKRMEPRLSFKERFLYFVEFQVQKFCYHHHIHRALSHPFLEKVQPNTPFTVPGMESTVIRLLTRDYNQRPPTTLRSSAIQSIRQSSYF